MTKPPGHLLGMLYNQTAPKVARQVPRISKKLYDSGDISGSALDGLMANDWKQKPFAAAIADVNTVPTHVLKFRCPDSYITRSDFLNLYPIQRDRMYQVDGHLKPFTVVKSRNAANLLFNGAYYLVFRNHNHACTYLLETKGKKINGFELQLAFANPLKELRNLSLPFLDEQWSTAPAPEFELAITNTRYAEAYTLLKTSKEQMLKEDDVEPQFMHLNQFMDYPNRIRTVLVRNLPFGLAKSTLPRLLWDYDFLDVADQSKCFAEVYSDARAQAHLSLIRFADAHNAKRFVRNFHGMPWVQKKDEKKLYEPLLCEVLDS